MERMRNTANGIWKIPEGDRNTTKDARDTAKGARNMIEDGWNPPEGVWSTTEGTQDLTEETWDSKKELCARGLVWAAHRTCPRNDDEEKEENTSRGEAKDN